MAQHVEQLAKHARLAPSSADRWVVCAGSVAAEANEPNDDNQWSFEGGVAHKIFELCLSYDLDALDFHGQIYTKDYTYEAVDEESGEAVEKTGTWAVTVDDAMCEHLQEKIDELRDLGGKQFYEQRLDLGRWLPGQFGTLDVGVILEDQGLIIIDDLKFGAGVPVQAEWNFQLLIYAGGFWDQVASKVWTRPEKPRFRIVIYQPRNMGGGGSWEISYEELMLFMLDVKRAGARTYDENAPRVAGDKQCGYCKAAAAGKCKAYDEFNLAKFGATFDSIENEEDTMPDPETMDIDTRAKILKGAAGLRQWLNRLHAAAINDELSGKHSTILKAVAGRKGHRKWSDPVAAEEWLNEIVPADKDIFKPQEIVSPSGAEKLLGQKILMHEPATPPKRKPKKEPIICPLIEQPEGKPVLVPISDPRPRIEAYHERFSEYDNDED